MHEQSQTIERDGRYYNVSGVNGQVLEGPFNDLNTAVDSAKRRSMMAPSFDPGLMMENPAPLYTPPDVPTSLPVGPEAMPPAGPVPTGLPQGPAPQVGGVQPTITLDQGSAETQKLEAIGGSVEGQLQQLQAQNPGLSGRQLLGLLMAGVGDSLQIAANVQGGRAGGSPGALAARVKDIRGQGAARQDAILEREKFLSEIQGRIQTSKAADIAAQQHVFTLLGNTLQTNPSPEAVGPMIERGVGILAKSGVPPAMAERLLRGMATVPDSAIPLGKYISLWNPNTDRGRMGFKAVMQQVAAAYFGGPESRAAIPKIIDNAVASEAFSTLAPHAASLATDLKPQYPDGIPVSVLLASLRASKGRAPGAEAFADVIQGVVGPRDKRDDVHTALKRMGYRDMDLDTKVAEQQALDAAKGPELSQATKDALAGAGFTPRKLDPENPIHAAAIAAANTQAGVTQPAAAAGARTTAEKKAGLAPDIVDAEAMRAAKIKAAEQRIAAGQPMSIKDLKSDFDTIAKPFVTIRDAYATIVAMGKKQTPASDLGMIFGYMKLLDPIGSVREGEQATAQNAAAVPDRVRNLYNAMLTGAKLTPEQRQDFLGQSQALFRSRLESHLEMEKEYTRFSGASGVNAKQVITDYVGRFRSLIEPPKGFHQ